MANIPINLVGVGANWVIPAVLTELDFAQGPVAGYSGQRAAILIGTKTSGGSATLDTVVYGPDTAITCVTEADVIALFGTGSQLHRMFLRFAAVNKVTPLYFIAVTASGGAAATATMTIATTATSAGNHRFWYQDQFVDTGINTGDTVTTIATAICASINSQTRWGITAAPAAGVITITAKDPGPEGNWNRVQAQITPATSVIGTTTTLTANTFLTGGATLANNTTALSTILTGIYYYQVSGFSDATNLGRHNTQLLAQALPTGVARMRGVAGSIDTLANAITIATGLNSPRFEIEWSNPLDVHPSEMAAGQTALYAALETGAAVGVARKNFSNFPDSPTDVASWQWVAGRGGTGVNPTFPAQQQSALTNGLTPIINTKTGANLIKRITSRSLNGSNADFRIRDAHKVTVCDYWCDDAAALTSLEFGGKDLLPDPVIGQPPPGPQATTPRAWGDELKRLVQDYGNAGQWSYPPGIAVPFAGATPADTINSAAQVQAETNPPTRMSALFPLSPVNIADVFALLAQQVG